MLPFFKKIFLCMRKIRIPRFPISQPLLFLSPSLFLPSSASNGTRFTAPPPHPIQRGPRWIARTAFPPPFENRKKSPLRNLFFPGGFDEYPFSTTDEIRTAPTTNPKALGYNNKCPCDKFRRQILVPRREGKKEGFV